MNARFPLFCITLVASTSVALAAGSVSAGSVSPSVEPASPGGTLAPPPMSLGAGQPLALSDALDTARRGSFSIGSAQARIQAAQARLRAAGAFPGPTLTLARAFGSSHTAGFDEDILLSQVIELGKRGSRLQGARADAESARFDREGVLNDLDFAIRSTFFDALRTGIERDLATQALKTAQTFQNAAQIQFTAGDVPRANVVRAGIELLRAQSALEAAQSDQSVRLAALRSLLALPDEAPLQLGEKLGFSPVTYDLAALQELAAQKRADLQSARAALRSRQAGVQTARALRRPDGFVEARRAAITSYAGAPNGNSLRIGAVIPLFDFGRNRAGMSEARAGVLEQRATLDQATRAARLDVATTFERFVAAQKAVQSFNNGRLAQARELLDMAQTGYEHGANSYLELIDAQTVERNEEADYARALAAWNTALADLQRAVGGQLP